MTQTIDEVQINGVDHYEISEEGEVVERIYKNPDTFVEQDEQGNDVIAVIPDNRPWLHLEIDADHIKPNGDWFIDGTSATFTLSIRESDDPQSSIVTAFEGEFFANVRNRNGDDVFSQYLSLLQGQGQLNIVRSDLPIGTTVVNLDESDFSQVRLVSSYKTYVA